MERLFFTLSICLELLTIIITILVFFRGRLRLSEKRSFLFLFLLFLVTTSSYFLFRPIFGNGSSFQTVYSCYTLFLITILLSWLFQEGFFVTAFLVFAARNYIDGVNLLSQFVSAFYRSLNNLFSSQGAAMGFLCRLTVYSVFLPVLYRVYKNYLFPAISSTKALDIWKYLWLVPVCFYLFYRLGIAPIFMVDPICWNSNVAIFSTVWLLGMYFCQLALFRLLSESSQNLLLTEKLRSAELLTEMEKKQYGLLRKNIEEARKARHDLRHHLLALRGYAELKDADGCIHYIDEFLSQTDSYHLQQYCENYAVDSIISYYAQTARDLKIPINIQVQLPAVLPIPETDICTILGNLLSNAVEATGRQTQGKPFIRLNMGMAGSSMLAVSVINSHSSKIQEKDGVFLSSNHPGEGIGTMSIRHIADKYHGMVKFHYEDGVFESSLLLNAELES